MGCNLKRGPGSRALKSTGSGSPLGVHWFCRLSLLGIVILSIAAFSYNLDRDFTEDEFQVVSTAYGYHQTGELFKWEWIAEDLPNPDRVRSGDSYYPRAWPHTILVAKSFSLFGVSERTSRVPSVLLTIMLVITSYFFTRFFIGRADVALAVAFALPLSSTVILVLAQYTRMYALLAPLFMLFAWSVYRGITEQFIATPRNGIQRFLSRNCNFHYGYLAASVGLLALNYTVYINSLFLLPATYLFVLYLVVTTHERRYLVLGGVGAIGLVVLIYIAQSSRGLEHITEYLSPFQRGNIQYVDFITGYPFRQIGSVLFFAGLVGALLIRDRELRHRRIFLYAITGTALCLFVLVADRYSHYSYTSHVMPIGLALVLAAFFFLIDRLRSKTGRQLSYGLFVGWLIYLFVSNFNMVYRDDHRRGVFSDAYATVVENSDRIRT